MSGTTRASAPVSGRLPAWVPEAARRYLAHTEDGLSIRSLARRSGCHASTVLRQIRKVETLRDDILVDEALRDLGRIPLRRPCGMDIEEPEAMPLQTEITHDDAPAGAAALPDAATLGREAPRILRRLCEPGAVLAVADEMEKAVIVRDTADGTTQRLAVLERGLARAMALKDWIACAAPGRVSRYTITAAGRTALQRMLVGPAEQPGPGGMAEAPQAFRHRAAAPGGDETDDDIELRRIRFGQTDTPIAMLARRRDRDGRPFLDDSLVRAGERLAEDFELSGMDPRTTQNWDSFLTAGAATGFPGTGSLRGAAAARKRVADALAELGPGLGDVVLRCCCWQQGLETAERRMGWSARSGKIVLRIALQRLKRHYDDLGPEGGMIG